MAIALPASFVALRKATQRGWLDWEDFNPAVQSWIGHARHAETEGLRRVIFGGTIFCRGADQRPSRSLSGGSWSYVAWRVCAASRLPNYFPGNRDDYIGLRLARDN